MPFGVVPVRSVVEGLPDMRRRRPLVEFEDVPDDLEVFDVSDWPSIEVGVAYERWLEIRVQWLREHVRFPLELCDGSFFTGTGTEFGLARDEWEALHDCELPSQTRVPDDPFDPSTL